MAIPTSEAREDSSPSVYAWDLGSRLYLSLAMLVHLTSACGHCPPGSFLQGLPPSSRAVRNARGLWVLLSGSVHHFGLMLVLFRTRSGVPLRPLLFRRVQLHTVLRLYFVVFAGGFSPLLSLAVPGPLFVTQFALSRDPLFLGEEGSCRVDLRCPGVVLTYYELSRFTGKPRHVLAYVPHSFEAKGVNLSERNGRGPPS